MKQEQPQLGNLKCRTDSLSLVRKHIERLQRRSRMFSVVFLREEKKRLPVSQLSEHIYIHAYCMSNIMVVRRPSDIVVNGIQPAMCIAYANVLRFK